MPVIRQQVSSMDRKPLGKTLIVLGGLPGVGKTSLARKLAQQPDMVLLRIDSIEHALRHAGSSVVAGDVSVGHVGSRSWARRRDGTPALRDCRPSHVRSYESRSGRVSR